MATQKSVSAVPDVQNEEGKPKRKRKVASGPRSVFVTYDENGPLSVFPSSWATHLLSEVDAAAAQGRRLMYKRLTVPQKPKGEGEG